jgi:hypothetical protein
LPRAWARTRRWRPLARTFRRIWEDVGGGRSGAEGVKAGGVPQVVDWIARIVLVAVVMVDVVVVGVLRYEGCT